MRYRGICSQRIKSLAGLLVRLQLHEFVAGNELNFTSRLEVAINMKQHSGDGDGANSATVARTKRGSERASPGGQCASNGRATATPPLPSTLDLLASSPVPNSPLSLETFQHLMFSVANISRPPFSLGLRPGTISISTPSRLPSANPASVLEPRSYPPLLVVAAKPARVRQNPSSCLSDIDPPLNQRIYCCPHKKSSRLLC